MKRFLKEYPFISSLILTGVMVILTFAAAKIAGEGMFAGDMVHASGDAETAAEADADPKEADAETAETNETTPVINLDNGAAEMPSGEAEGTEAAEQTAAAEAEVTETETEGAEEEEASAEAVSEQESEEEHPVGVTEFIYYEPVEVNSRYYEDPGKRPLTTNYPYSTVERDYFNDAAFIGDSRMVGLYDYAGFEGADFFCDNGFCVYTWQKKREVKYQNERRKVVLMDALSEKQYKKVYLMIGMNDCGYGNSDTFRQGIHEIIDEIVARQPEAILYLMANMYITKEKEDDVFNNIDINSKNVILAECADGERSFYLEYNELYQDENGYLNSDLTFDGAHLYGSQYGLWVDFLLTHAVVR